MNKGGIQQVGLANGDLTFVTSSAIIIFVIQIVAI